MEYKKDNIKGITWDMPRCPQVQLFLKDILDLYSLLATYKDRKKSKKGHGLKCFGTLLFKSVHQVCCTKNIHNNRVILLTIWQYKKLLYLFYLLTCCSNGSILSFNIIK